MVSYWMEKDNCNRESQVQASLQFYKHPIVCVIELVYFDVFDIDKSFLLAIPRLPFLSISSQLSPSTFQLNCSLQQHYPY